MCEAKRRSEQDFAGGWSYMWLFSVKKDARGPAHPIGSPTLDVLASGIQSP